MSAKYLCVFFIKKGDTFEYDGFWGNDFAAVERRAKKQLLSYPKGSCYHIYFDFDYLEEF